MAVGDAVSLLIPASVGELIDKITILEIKQQRIHDPAKQDNIARELTALMQVVQQSTSLAIRPVNWRICADSCLW